MIDMFWEGFKRKAKMHDKSPRDDVDVVFCSVGRLKNAEYLSCL